MSTTSSHSSLNFSRRNQTSSNFHRHSLGSSISVHHKSIDLQNYLSRSLIVLYDIETVHTLKIFSTPCIVRNIGSVENINWITNPTLQRSNSGERHRLGKGVTGVGSASNNVSSFSVYISGSNSKHALNPLHSSSNDNKNLSMSSSIYSSRFNQPYSSKSASTLLYTSGLLLSFLLPYHLALFP